MPTDLNLDRSEATATDALRITRVLAAFDQDDHGRHAVRWARMLATDVGAGFALVASTTNASAEHDPVDQLRFENVTADEVAAWLDTEHITADSVSVAESTVEDAVMNAMRPGDVVVLGAHHHEGITPWALGSRPHELAHHLSCPLILVPPMSAAEDGAPILVGLDGTEANRVVVDWAKALATAVDRPLEAVYARDPMYDTFDSAGNYGDAEWTARLEAEMEGLPLHERSDRAEQALRDVAHQRHAYLTVVGVREHHSLGGVLLGKLVDHLIHTPHGPIAIVTHGTTERLAASDAIVTSHAAAVASRIHRLVVPTDASDRALARCHVAALRLASSNGFAVVLYDRSRERWAGDPDDAGPLTIDEIDPDERPELVSQMRRFLDAGVAVTAHLAAIPSITALLETVALEQVDGIMIPDELEHPRLMDRVTSQHSHTAALIDHLVTLKPSDRPAVFVVPRRGPVSVIEHGPTAATTDDDELTRLRHGH